MPCAVSASHLAHTHFIPSHLSINDTCRVQVTASHFAHTPIIWAAFSRYDQYTVSCNTRLTINIKIHPNPLFFLLVELDQIPSNKRGVSSRTMPTIKRRSASFLYLRDKDLGYCSLYESCHQGGRLWLSFSTKDGRVNRKRLTLLLVRKKIQKNTNAASLDAIDLHRWLGLTMTG